MYIAVYENRSFYDINSYMIFPYTQRQVHVTKYTSSEVSSYLQ